MRKHYFSSYSIFESFSEFFSIELEQTSGRLTFIDFGCGPMTSVLAFNQIYKDKFDNYKLNYIGIGIDISDAMLQKADKFSKTSLFNSNTSFCLIKSIKELEEESLDESFRLSNTIVLNFSYLFANLSDVQTIELANDINKMVEKYLLNKHIVVYQNPKNKHHNFTKFKRYLKNFDNVVRKTETVSYKNKQQSSYDKTETFTYEILTN